ncbi:MAG: DUF1360 domain-containing protein [Bacteroidota bacterium]|nr:DUF1360 domain-containing protein [Bacteroidota bacterium]
MDWFYFLISSLAVWRLTHLLNKEDGPFDIIFLIREKAGSGFFAKLLDCFYCLSIWIALPFAIWSGIFWVEKLILWLALSGAACLLEQATTKNNMGNKTEYRED